MAKKKTTEPTTPKIEIVYPDIPIFVPTTILEVVTPDPVITEIPPTTIPPEYVATIPHYPANNPAPTLVDPNELDDSDLPISNEELIAAIQSIPTIDHHKLDVVVNLLNEGAYADAVSKMREVQTIQLNKKVSILDELEKLV